MLINRELSFSRSFKAEELLGFLSCTSLLLTQKEVSEDLSVLSAGAVIALATRDPSRKLLFPLGQFICL